MTFRSITFWPTLHSPRFILCFTLFSGICLLQTTAAAQEMSAQEFLQLYSASQNRVQSLSVTWQQSLYKLPDISAQAMPVIVKSITEQMQGSNVARTVTHICPDQQQYTIVHSRNEKCAKMYEQSPNQRPEGRIESADPRSNPDAPQQSLMRLIYNPFGGFHLVKSENCLLSTDTDTGLLKCVVRMNDDGLAWVAIVDPSKGFVPVAHAWCLPPDEKWWDNSKNMAVPVGSGILPNPNDQIERLLTTEGLSVCWMNKNTEMKQFGEIWLPMKMERFLKEQRETINITSIELNSPIPDDAFDFRFPAGTRVIDKIANRTYTAGRARDISLILIAIIIFGGGFSLLLLKSRNAT